jgi:hypothetical protein
MQHMEDVKCKIPRWKSFANFVAHLGGFFVKLRIKFMFSKVNAIYFLPELAYELWDFYSTWRISVVRSTSR